MVVKTEPRRRSAANLPIAALPTTREASTNVVGGRKKQEKVSNMCILSAVVVGLMHCSAKEVNMLFCCFYSRIISYLFRPFYFACPVQRAGANKPVIP
jgi:hypothetical protein